MIRTCSALLSLSFSLSLVPGCTVQTSDGPAEEETDVVADPVERVETRLLETATAGELAEPVSGCIWGGAGGRPVTYAEASSDARERSLAFDYDAALAEELGLPTDPVDLELDPIAIFGIDPDATV